MSDITIQVKLPNQSSKLDVVINTGDTILATKEKIAVVSGTPAALQRLIFAGKVLKDNQLVSECSEFLRNQIFTSSIFSHHIKKLEIR